MVLFSWQELKSDINMYSVKIRLWGPLSPFLLRTRVLSVVIKWPGSIADKIPLSNAKVKN